VADRAHRRAAFERSLAPRRRNAVAPHLPAILGAYPPDWRLQLAHRSEA